VIGTVGAFPTGQLTEGGGRALGVGCRTSPGDHFSALDDPASATFLLGQSLMPGINALLFGSLMYRLVPRLIPVAAWELSLGVRLVVKGFRALPDHNRNGRRHHAGRAPGRRRLTAGQHDLARHGPGRIVLTGHASPAARRRLR
jgi:hypothetical protein